MEQHRIVSIEEWLTARRALLADEKAFTHARDALAAQRQTLPWVRVDKTYTFDTPQGKRTLADLFDGRSQLIVYHFMLGPDWEEGCRGCSFVSDHIDGTIAHLEHHDVSYVAVSRAPLAKLEAFKKRMGWHFRWVSSNQSDFNFDYHVSFTEEDKAKGKVDYNFTEQNYESDEMPGASVFFKDEKGDIFHTYSTYARGLDMALTTYVLLELTPKGRNEQNGMLDWMRHHDRYEDAASAKAGGCCSEMSHAK
ncbi:DUF899 domain-containing protein [Caballeronia humi]|uniref:DUF899 domain-containing protein n=1 Tax=Caballeronia humi TaxID=326474 RepID=A0A158J5Y4_9BURK|nr:thioredoxin family protein [Caballeronia humi]SAL63759.1 hypothetical protein AWB65_05938 [Caballeronia humi]